MSAKPKPDPLPGDRKRRVFIGGHYDLLPTLRLIADYINALSFPDDMFVPILPIDYDIPIEETIDEDLRMLGQCSYAIFDLSDLGAQLVEMQEARQKRIPTLLVYPVRERRNEPERGRRTVLSFGLPHFGYMTFDELKGIVWRFLWPAPTERDPVPRVIHSPEVDRHARRVRVLLGRDREEEAEEYLAGC